MNDIMEELANAVQEACQRHPSVTEAGGAATWNPDLWAALEEMGVTLLGIPEDAGGDGGDLSLAVAVLEVLGQHSINVPYAETALQAAWLLAEAGVDIPPGPLAAAAAGPDVTMEENHGQWLLNGTLPRIAWARHAQHIVVLIGRRVVVLDPGQVTITHGANIAGEPRDSIEMENLEVANERVHQLPESSSVSHDAFNARGALARIALIAGAALGALNLSVEYSRQRQQFGRSINAFQAVQQYLATMAGEVMLCRASAKSAATVLENSPHDRFVIASAKVATEEAAGKVAKIAHQIHGAIGFTDEHDLRLSTTRLWSWREEGGSTNSWARELGSRSLEVGSEGIWSELVDR